MLHDTGSVLATGVAGVFATVPMIGGGALGGVLVGRFGFRRAAIVADLASGVTVLAIPVLAATTGLPFWALLALVFASGLLDTPGNTAKAALVPDLAELCRVKLTRVTGASGAISRSATMVGASVAAGMLVLKPVYVSTASPDGALFGVMVACFAFGALTGAGLFGWIGHRPGIVTLAPLVGRSWKSLDPTPA